MNLTWKWKIGSIVRDSVTVQGEMHSRKMENTFDNDKQSKNKIYKPNSWPSSERRSNSCLARVITPITLWQEQLRERRWVNWRAVHLSRLSFRNMPRDYFSWPIKKGVSVLEINLLWSFCSLDECCAQYRFRKSKVPLNNTGMYQHIERQKKWLQYL